MSSNKFNPKEYYFSKPVMQDGKVEVVIVPKQPFDANGVWDTGERYHALEDYFIKTGKKYVDVTECIFSPEEDLSEKEVEDSLRKQGFLYNPKLKVNPDEESKEEGKYILVSMMIGLPASGKSTFAQYVLGNLPIVSKDLCNGSESQEMKRLEDLLSKGEHIVVDDTNYDRKSRAKIIALCHKYHAEVKAIYITTDKQTCIERNRTREKKIPEVAIHTIAKRFEKPKLEEGFIDISDWTKEEAEDMIAESKKRTGMN